MVHARDQRIRRRVGPAPTPPEQLQLAGRLHSPYVHGTAISLQLLGLPLAEQPTSLAVSPGSKRIRGKAWPAGPGYQGPGASTIRIRHPHATCRTVARPHCGSPNHVPAARDFRATAGRRCRGLSAADVLVVGGGPARLDHRPRFARRRAVATSLLVVEGTTIARFHIGESLLPANVALFERARRARPGRGASACRSAASSSCSPDHDHQQLHRVRRSLGQDRCRTRGRCGARSSTRLLFRHAAAAARARSKAAACARSRSTPTARPCRPSSTTAARRSLARALRRRRHRAATRCSRTSSACKHKNPAHNSSALFGHFTRRRAARKASSRATSAIFWFEHGWFWFIPLADGTTSVGAVLLAVLPEVARQAAEGVLRTTRSRCARASPSGCRTQRWSTTRSTRPATTRYMQRALQRRALPDARRCLRLHRPGVLVRRLPGDAQRASTAPTSSRRALDRPRDGARHARRFERTMRARAARVLRGSSSASRNPTIRDMLHAPGEPAAREGGADLAARRRHLRQDADLAFDLRPEGLVLPGLARPTSRHAGASWRRRRVNIRDVAGCRRREHSPRAAPGRSRFHRGRLPCALQRRPGPAAVAGSGDRAAVRRRGSGLPWHDRKPLWELGVGIAAVRFPRLSRRPTESADVLSAAAALRRLPRRQFLRVPTATARAPSCSPATRVTVDVSLGGLGVPTRQQRTTTPARACPTWPATFEIGPNLEVGPGSPRDRRPQARPAHAAARQAITLERRPRGAIGITVSPNLEPRRRAALPAAASGCSPGRCVANQRHHQHYYGVAPELRDRRRGRPTTRAGGFGRLARRRARVAPPRRPGYRRLRCATTTSHGAPVRAQPAGPAATHDLAAGFGVSWIFAASSQRVSAGRLSSTPVPVPGRCAIGCCSPLVIALQLGCWSRSCLEPGRAAALARCCRGAGAAESCRSDLLASTARAGRRPSGVGMMQIDSSAPRRAARRSRAR